MIVLLWIRFIVGIIMILCGLIIFAIELFGVFEFHYVLNRMHAAAMGDTLGIALSMTGLIVLCGLPRSKCCWSSSFCGLHLLWHHICWRVLRW